MPFADENFFHKSGNPQMDEFVARQLAGQNDPRPSGPMSVQESARRAYERRFGSPNPKGASEQWMSTEDQIRQFQAQQAQMQEMQRRFLMANMLNQ